MFLKSVANRQSDRCNYFRGGAELTILRVYPIVKPNEGWMKTKFSGFRSVRKIKVKRSPVRLLWALVAIDGKRGLSI